MPDISLLPGIAAHFSVTVDMLLGLVPMEDAYRPIGSGEAGYWSERADYLERTRKNLWNEDYMRFLIQDRWRIDTPVRVADFGCGTGFLGQLMMPFLPAGSTYTGIDHDPKLLALAEQCFTGCSWPVRLVKADLHDFEEPGRYDLVVCQALLWHLNHADEAIARMVRTVRPGGRIVCIEVNREFECDGLYLDGMDYTLLCERDGWRNLWRRELAVQGRDHAVGMRLPFLMREYGLTDIEVCLNDKAQYAAPGMPGYEQALRDFACARGWDRMPDADAEKALMTHLVNHGMQPEEARAHCARQQAMAAHVRERGESLSWLHVLGMLIATGIRAGSTGAGGCSC